MKKMKKLLVLILSVLMVLGTTAMTSFAAKGDPITATSGKITIENAAKGETYKIFKIFDATISKVEGDNGISDSVAYKYTGTLPTQLAAVFEKIGTTDYVKVKTGKTEAEVLGAVKAYMETLADTAAVDSQEAQGGAVEFTNLAFGYYGIKSTQGAVVTIDSTNPEAVVYDKNTTEPRVTKSVDDADVYIGQTVTYTVEAITSNWIGTGSNAKQVVKYEIQDTTPAFLSNVTVTSIKVDADGNTTTTNDQTELAVQQFNNKKITIDWATGTKGNYTNTYKNGAKIIVTYTAVVTAQANVGDADGNRNEVTLQPLVDTGKDEPEPSQENYKDDETIKTYGGAIHKVDDEGNDLAGAKFKIAGLQVSGTNGQYTVTKYDPQNVTLDNSTEMTVDNEGYIYILGLASDTNLSVTETEAPAGYNKLTAAETLIPIKMSETTSYTAKTIYKDANGKVVYEEVTGGSTKEVTANYEDLKTEANVLEIENNKGTELPSTGGMGTTILYIIGGALVVGCAIMLIAKKRTENK